MEQGLSAEAPATPGPFSRVGNYELIEEVARGGMGVVYKARQSGLDRIVAVKMILGGHFAGSAEMRRFRAEGRAVAALQHPGIVAIHEIGEHEGLLYYSMDFIEGRNLAQLTRDGPWSAARAALCLRDITEAIRYAHEHGVLHRDLKPSNVIIDAEGKPRVTDFGLAKRLGAAEVAEVTGPTSGAFTGVAGEVSVIQIDPVGRSEVGRSFQSQSAMPQSPITLAATEELTLTGQVLGSPNFMPPEQALGRRSEIGPASDIYSLGALLYHLLTGRPPFLADSITATLRLVTETDPVVPRLLAPTTPRDLETICLKCLDKDPRRRYQTAEQLADELARFLRDEPIRARPVGRWEKFHRWTRRHPVIAALSGVIGLLLVAVALISTVAAMRLQSANRAGQEKLREAYLSQARANRWSGRPGRRFDSMDVIRKAVAIRPGLDLRNEAVAAMALVDVRILQSWDNPDAPGSSFDEELAHASRAEGQSALVRRVVDNGEVARVSEPGATNCYCTTLTPNSRYLIAGFDVKGKYPFVVTDLREGKAVLRQPDLWLRSYDFSADGRWLLVTSQAKQGHFSVLYDLVTLRPVITNPLPALAAWSVFNPSGDKIAIAYQAIRDVEIRHPQTGAILERLAHGSGVSTLCWNADGSRLLVGALDMQAYLWDTTGSPKLLYKLPHAGSGVKGVFHPTGALLLTVAWDSVLHVWDAFDGKELLRTPTSDIMTGFTPDGRRMVIAPSPHSMAMIELDDAKEWQRLRFAGSYTRSCAFSPDGRLLVSGHRDGGRIWDVAMHKELAHFNRGSEVVKAMFHPSGTNLLVFFPDRPAEWRPLSEDPQNVGRGTDAKRLRLGAPVVIGGSKAMQFPQVDHAAKTLLGIDGGRVQAFDLETSQFTRRLEVPFQPHRLALAPSGELGLVGPYRLDTHRLTVYAMSTGKAVHTVEMTGVNSGAFSFDSRLLFAGSPRAVRCLEIGSWNKRYEILRQTTGDTVPYFAFSPDGTMGAFTISQHAIRLFEPATGRELATLEAPDESAVHYLAFSPDGTTLAVANRGSSIHLWGLRAIRQQLAGLKLDWDAPPLTEAVPLAKNSLTVTVADGERLAFAPRDADCTPRQIDLMGFYNAALTNSWLAPNGVDNSFSSLPVGTQTLDDGIAFDIRGIVQLSCSRPEVGNSYPQEVRAIPIARQSPRLHFLHATAWNPKAAGSDVGEYVIRYSDGTERLVPLVYAENIGALWESWNSVDRMKPGTTVAWTGRSPLSERAGTRMILFHFRWDNPRPTALIASITFRSRMTECAPFLVAITAE